MPNYFPVTFRQQLLVLTLAGWATLLSAADAPAPTPASPPTVGPVIELPKIQVTSSRLKQLDKEIAKLDKLIAREKKKVKVNELDRALNSDKVSTAAAIFGGNSASHLSAIAATRVNLMESERTILEGMKFPLTKKELADLETELDQLRITRRNLDNAANPSR
ncbi:MAG: hypothetical protein HYV75_11285 [Opitutae bacterium]|nr:hypothetical protein [Opitutae bacterium]